MIIKDSAGRKLFLAINTLLLLLAAIICIFPLVHVFALSLSSSAAATAGDVKLWPVGFTLKSYEFVMDRPAFIKAFFISVKRLLLGVPISLLVTMLIAYPLSKEKTAFRARGFFVWFFVITMLFSGGMVPTFMTVRMTGILNSIWALVLPCAVNTFNVVLMLNFFRSLPRELEEAAFMDGAGHWVNFWKICLPLSKASIATVALFIIVAHWNSWFDGLIYMNSNEKYPLQSLLQTTVVTINTKIWTEHDLSLLKMVNDRTVRAAEIFITMIPILVVYPFLQRYFTTGIVLGSVKG